MFPPSRTEYTDKQIPCGPQHGNTTLHGLYKKAVTLEQNMPSLNVEQLKSGQALTKRANQLSQPDAKDQDATHHCCPIRCICIVAPVPRLGGEVDLCDILRNIWPTTCDVGKLGEAPLQSKESLLDQECCQA